MFHNFSVLILFYFVHAMLLTYTKAHTTELLWLIVFDNDPLLLWIVIENQVWQVPWWDRFTVPPYSVSYFFVGFAYIRSLSCWYGLVLKIYLVSVKVKYLNSIHNRLKYLKNKITSQWEKSDISKDGLSENMRLSNYNWTADYLEQSFKILEGSKPKHTFI